MTQKIGVAAIIVNDKDEVLLMKRPENSRYYQGWFVPCGDKEPNETPRRGIEREVKDETSLSVKAMKEVYRVPNEDNILEIAYVCKIISGTPKVMEHEKCEGMEYFPLNHLPEGTHKRALEILASYKQSSHK